MEKNENFYVLFRYNLYADLALYVYVIYTVFNR